MMSSEGAVAVRSGWKELQVPFDEVDIGTVLLSGQSFRWKKQQPGSSSEEEAEYIGVFGHRLWILRQNATTIHYQSLPKEKGDNHEAEEDKLLKRYFQLDVSLPALYKSWAEKDARFASLTQSNKNLQGIRILAQDPIECLFSFICSSNNNIKRISQMVEKLCTNYGERITSLDGQSYFDFPKVTSLTGDLVEKTLREEKFGYRAGFIAKSAQKIVENGGEGWLEGLRMVDYEEARTQLQTLPGIGRKVADCICLMSLGFSQAIPVDTHIHQVASQYIPHLTKAKTMTDKIYAEITNHFRALHGSHAGWAQSVLFTSRLQLKDKEEVYKGGRGRKTQAEENGSPTDIKRNKK